MRAGWSRATTAGPGWRRGLLVVAEPARSASELAASVLLAPVLAVQRRGDGHCVLVIPGWLADDRSTALLRRYLNTLGYDARGWGLGVNRGATLGNVAALRQRLMDLARSSGTAVSIIGWSLGGHYAYQLARRHPASVRQLITLGAPAGTGHAWTRTASRTVDRMAERPAARRRPVRATPRPWDERAPLRVPVTAIHSRTDPILTWQRSLVPTAQRRQNISVPGSHTGLAHNPLVLHVIADRLAQSPQCWKPFRPAPLLNALFPTH